MLVVIINDLVSYQSNDYGQHYNLPGLRQWTPATLVQYPTGRFTLNIEDSQPPKLLRSNGWKGANERSNVQGIPPNIDAALQYSNGRTYFFKDGQYYRFDNSR